MSANEPSLKVFSLKTLGFICEDIDSECLDSDVILTAIVEGMRKETQNVEIIVAACDAFFNCLKFIEKNFEKENEVFFSFLFFSFLFLSFFLSFYYSFAFILSPSPFLTPPPEEGYYEHAVGHSLCQPR